MGAERLGLLAAAKSDSRPDRIGGRASVDLKGVSGEPSGGKEDVVGIGPGDVDPLNPPRGGHAGQEPCEEVAAVGPRVGKVEEEPARGTGGRVEHGPAVDRGLDDDAREAGVVRLQFLAEEVAHLGCVGRMHGVVAVADVDDQASSIGGAPLERFEGCMKACDEIGLAQEELLVEAVQHASDLLGLRSQPAFVQGPGFDVDASQVKAVRRPEIAQDGPNGPFQRISLAHPGGRIGKDQDVGGRRRGVRAFLFGRGLEGGQEVALGEVSEGAIRRPASSVP